MRTSNPTAYVFSLGLCLATLSMVVPAVATTQQGRQLQPSVAQPQHWWWPAPRGSAERGKLEEIKDKRRVYVTFFTFTGERDSGEIRSHVLRALASYEGVDVVSRVEQADFALHVSASRLPLADPKRSGSEPTRSIGPPTYSVEPDWPTTLELSVLVRGAEQADGTHRPRIVRQKSQNVWDEVGATAGSGVRAFIKQLKKVRGEK